MTKDGTFVPARKRTSQDTLWFLCAAELHAADMSMTTVRAECAPRSSRYRTLVLNRPSNFSALALFTRVLLNFNTLSRTRLVAFYPRTQRDNTLHPPRSHRGRGDNSSRNRNNREITRELDHLFLSIREMPLNLPSQLFKFLRTGGKKTGEEIVLLFPCRTTIFFQKFYSKEGIFKEQLEQFTEYRVYRSLTENQNSFPTESPPSSQTFDRIPYDYHTAATPVSCGAPLL